MDAAAESEPMEPAEAAEPSGIIMEEILPPRLEDAGLEDCALPIDSIHVAFLKAATAVGSRFASDDEDDEEEDADPETPEESSDRTDYPTPATSQASEVAIKSECAAVDGVSGGGTTMKDANGEACAVGVQEKLQIR